jgi:transposase
MPIVLAKTDKLSQRMIHMIEDLCTDWRHLNGRIEAVSKEIETLSEQDDGAKRLMTVPGIGPIISTATVAAIGTGEVFSKGRDFGAWLGLVPKQMSTGGRTILGPISKRPGDGSSSEPTLRPPELAAFLFASSCPKRKGPAQWPVPSVRLPSLW